MAASVEMDGQATICPVVYVRRDGRVQEHLMDPHPLHEYDGDEYRRRVAEALA